MAKICQCAMSYGYSSHDEKKDSQRQPEVAQGCIKLRVLNQGPRLLEVE